MLYDILIIDDDFSGETVLDEIDLKSTNAPGQSVWKETIMPLYFELVRDNLKVIWSTGELDDLEKLSKSQLSKVRYIICDLHLLGIDTHANNKTIISKIIGILEKLKDSLGGNISFLVNSKYIDSHENIEQELKNALSKKYSIRVFSEKNVIPDAQKQKLLDTSLLSHIKEKIIEKHLEVERCLNEKIDIKSEVLEELSFNSKHKIVKKTHNLNGYNREIQKLNESRNAIAHAQINSLDALKRVEKIDSDIKEFKNFSNLFDYLEKIDMLINNITDSKAKSAPAE